MHFLHILFLSFMPYLIQEDSENNLQNLSFEEFESSILEAKSEDTLLIINFWATWCGPCIKELPYFEKVNSEKNDKPVRVILVSLDFKKNYESKLLPFIDKNNLRSELIWLDTNMSTDRINRVYSEWSGAIPATLFIKNGKILKFMEQELNQEELDNTINNLL